jgi:hypothetical protein
MANCRRLYHTRHRFILVELMHRWNQNDLAADLRNGANVSAGGAIGFANGICQHCECGIEREFRLIGGADQAGQRLYDLFEACLVRSDGSCVDRVHFRAP